jgi:hypothetical protein
VLMTPAIQYVAADEMTLQTRTSSLWGTFNVSESLIMNSTKYVLGVLGFVSCSSAVRK